MKSIKKKKKLSYLFRGIVLIALISAILLIQAGGSSPFFSGAAQDYFDALLEAGFPTDYAMSLTELHLLHPNWSFIPLLITEAQPKYTWNYVLQQENKESDNNLIPSSAAYIPYRHPLNSELYDAGSYQISDAGLAYFMDPRNFLNETDIFQFFDLSETEAPKDSVRAVLRGTFMEDGILENGESYADYIYDIGIELGVNPVYLGVKIRQEMGVRGTSPVISGTCGTLLASYYRDHVQESESGSQVLTPSEGYTEEELLLLDGYYNFFNISASGNGTFLIYYNAIQAAIKGTPSMSEEWGNSPAWNTRWKAIYGGAYRLKTRYVDAYKSTIYLQKFNVDSRASDNFWGQYAQTVTAAMSEARTLFQAFAASDAVDGECSFLIPVYADMPENRSADPAHGSCYATLPATKRYDYSISFDLPGKAVEENAALYTNLEIEMGKELRLAGTASHTYGITQLEYSWDGAEWIALPEGETFDFSVPIPSDDLSVVGEHILLLRANAAYDANDSTKKNSYQVLLAVLYVHVAPPPTVYMTVRTGESEEIYSCYAGSELALPTCDKSNFVGWIGSDGSFLPQKSRVLMHEDLSYEALFLELRYLNGAAISLGEETYLRFSSVISDESVQRIANLPENSISYRAVLYRDTDDLCTVKTSQVTMEATDGSCWHRIFADTPILEGEELSIPYSIHFSVFVTFSDGSSTVLKATGNPSLRSARDVARLALNDPYHTYSPTVREKLLTITTID